MNNMVTIFVDNKTADLIVQFINAKLEQYKTMEKVREEILAQLEAEAGSYII